MPDAPVTYPAVVAQVIDDDRIVINRGSEHGVKLGQRFLLYTVSDKDIIDPVTNESLGKLELTKGTGVVTHVQPKMATVKSDRTDRSTRTITRRNRTNGGFFYLGDQEVEEISPRAMSFDDPKVGDLVKPV